MAHHRQFLDSSPILFEALKTCARIIGSKCEFRGQAHGTIRSMTSKSLFRGTPSGVDLQPGSGCGSDPRHPKFSSNPSNLPSSSIISTLLGHLRDSNKHVRGGPPTAALAYVAVGGWSLILRGGRGAKRGCMTSQIGQFHHPASQNGIAQSGGGHRMLLSANEKGEDRNPCDLVMSGARIRWPPLRNRLSASQTGVVESSRCSPPSPPGIPCP